MKKFYLFMLALLVSLSSMAWTVKFTNPKGWAQVAVWAWNGSNNYTGGTWPGKLMTKEGDVWTYTGEGSPSMIIFNNNNKGEQTGNLAFVDGATYDFDGPIGVSVEKECFLVGPSPLDWGSKTDGYVFTKGSNDSFTLHIAEAPASFKCKVLYGADYLTTTDNLVSGTTYTLYDVPDGGEMDLSGLKNIDMTFTAPDKLKITFDGDTPVVNYGGWYLNVQGDFNGWNPAGEQYSCALSASGLGEVKDLVIGTGEFELKIWNGTNDIFMGTSTPVTPGKAVTVKEGGGHMTIAGATANSKYDVSFNAATNVMVVTEVGGDDPDPLPETGVYYQLHGQLTGNNNWESVDMTLNGDVWEYTGTLVAGEFGIRKCYENSTVTNWIGGGATVTETDKAYNFTADDVNSSSTLVGNYTVKYNPTAKTIEFVEAGEIEHVIGYALRGNIVSGEWSDYKMTEESDGNWSVTLTVVPGEFGIKKTDNGAQIGWYSAKSADEKAVSEAGEFAATGIGGTNWASTLEGEYKFSFNPDSETLTITSEGVEPEPTPIQGKFGIVGSMNDWNAANAIEMTNMGDNVYSYTFDRLEQGSEFKICDAKSWTHSWGGEGISRADEAPFVLENGVAANAWYNSSVNFQVGQNLTDATVLFKYNENIEEPCEITLTGKTGIESIDVDNNAEVLYYNMHGQRVLNPTLGGMYIRVQGTKATKIAL